MSSHTFVGTSVPAPYVFTRCTPKAERTVEDIIGRGELEKFTRLVLATRAASPLARTANASEGSDQARRDLALLIATRAQELIVKKVERAAGSTDGHFADASCFLLRWLQVLELFGGVRSRPTIPVVPRGLSSGAGYRREGGSSAGDFEGAARSLGLRRHLSCCRVLG
ncbi:hypothetical protein BDY24DRAFT_372807 [Mrakia frigida]|uniref:uncharacterized protein n=1 Tax=Mrakia frigida TaxID=29902 RepID=UPI003FCC071D